MGGQIYEFARVEISNRSRDSIVYVLPQSGRKAGGWFFEGSVANGLWQSIARYCVCVHD